MVAVIEIDFRAEPMNFFPTNTAPRDV